VALVVPIFRRLTPSFPPLLSPLSSPSSNKCHNVTSGRIAEDSEHFERVTVGVEVTPVFPLFLWTCNVVTLTLGSPQRRKKEIQSKGCFSF
jgi:hypothetical protein